MQVPVVLPLAIVRLEDGLVGAGAGIVDEDIGAAEFLPRRIDQGSGAFDRRHVTGDWKRGYAMLARNPGLYSHRRLIEAARARGHLTIDEQR
jgi:hypothetical protein